MAGEDQSAAEESGGAQGSMETLQPRPANPVPTFPQRETCLQPASPNPSDNLHAALHAAAIEHPVVIEIFAGAARVTACLKHLGFTSSFGVDVDCRKAVSSRRMADLATPSGQRLCKQWLRCPAWRASWLHLRVALVAEPASRQTVLLLCVLIHRLMD